ncbi:MAG: diacylglycerol kinase family protein [Syntrophomonas sp.]
MKEHSFANSFFHALNGIVYVFHNERNMKIHAVAALAAIGLGCVFHLGRVEWGMLFITIFFVLAAETINTALEKTVDLITVEFQPLARLAKDMAAGAVLLSAINAIIMAFVIFGPHFLNLIPLGGLLSC